MVSWFGMKLTMQTEYLYVAFYKKVLPVSLHLTAELFMTMLFTRLNKRGKEEEKEFSIIRYFPKIKFQTFYLFSYILLVEKEMRKKII